MNDDSTAMQPGEGPAALHTPYTISLGKNTTRAWGHTREWPRGKHIATVHKLHQIAINPRKWLVVLHKEGEARPYETILANRHGLLVGQSVLVQVEHVVQEVISLYMGEDCA